MNSKAYVAVLALLSSTNAWAVFYGVGGQITRDGEYMVHTFTNASDSFTVTGSGEVEVLLVGGGGGGGAYGGGGGGGGQVVSTTVDLTTGDYPIVVGAGGAGAVASTETITSQASNGSDTIAFELTAKGGGAGGSKRAGYSGANGGGGGVGAYKDNPTSTLVNQGGQGQDGGFAGGASLQPEGYSHFKQAGGGGGGAGGPGADARLVNDAIVAGNGGCGVTNVITGCALGYGGGGGGGRSQGTTGEGIDGGGNGGIGQSSSNVTSGKAGVDGLGGGGGGGGRAVRVAANGGKGGCGAVIVRYKPTWPDRFEKIEVTGNYSYQRRKIDGVRYGLYTFTNDVSVKVTGNSYADLLLVGGGGGGGSFGGGGGAGGQVVAKNGYEILGGTYDIVIGPGGAGAVGQSGAAEAGGVTTAFGISAGGGGGGGTKDKGQDAANGGGGGADKYLNSGTSELTWAGGASTNGVGFSGGCSYQYGGKHACTYAGGGAGAGGPGMDAEPGQDSSSGRAGDGGCGVTNSITGVAIAYGGGGGGGTGNTSGYRSNGLDGGGKGGYGTGSDGGRALQGGRGEDGRGGGGGGGGRRVQLSADGQPGGCGTVILRVQEPSKGMMILFR